MIINIFDELGRFYDSLNECDRFLLHISFNWYFIWFLFLYLAFLPLCRQIDKWNEDIPNLVEISPKILFHLYSAALLRSEDYHYNCLECYWKTGILSASAN